MTVYGKQQVGKLRTYALVKNIFESKQYLHVITDSNVRSCYTKFRISAHRLEIKCGRYKYISYTDEQMDLFQRDYVNCAIKGKQQMKFISCLNVQNMIL